MTRQDLNLWATARACRGSYEPAVVVTTAHFRTRWSTRTVKRLSRVRTCISISRNGPSGLEPLCDSRRGLSGDSGFARTWLNRPSGSTTSRHLVAHRSVRRHAWNAFGAGAIPWDDGEVAGQTRGALLCADPASRSWPAASTSCPPRSSVCSASSTGSCASTGAARRGPGRVPGRRGSLGRRRARRQARGVRPLSRPPRVISAARRTRVVVAGEIRGEHRGGAARQQNGTRHD